MTRNLLKLLSAVKSSFQRDESLPDCGDDMSFDPGYLTLEPRRVLSADFSLIGGILDLDDFSQINDENVLIEDTGNQFRFALSEGTWTGTDSATISGNGTNVLLVDQSAVSVVNLNDSASIGLDVTFGDADLGSLSSTSVSVTGNIGQANGSSLIATDIGFDANRVSLTSATNDFDDISATAVQRISISDADEVNLNSLVAGDKIDVRADGIVSTDLLRADTIALNSTQGVVQQVNAQLEATNLILTGQGTFQLAIQTNDIQQLAASVDGDLSYVDADDFELATLSCDGTVISGITTTGNLSLVSGAGTISQETGAAFFVGGDAFFTTQGGDICLEFGDSDGDGLNDNRIVGSTNVNASGEVVIGEDEDVVINSVTGNGRFRFIGNNIQLNTSVSGTELLIQAADGFSSNENSIDIDRVLLTGVGDFDLSGNANSIDSLAAEIDGSLLVSSNTALNIGSLVFASNCGDVAICGVSVSNDLAIQVNNANLTQTAALVVGGRTTLSAGTGNIQLDSGDCDGDGVNENDLQTVEIVSAGDVDFVDINGFTLADVSVSGDAAFESGELVSAEMELTGTISTAGSLLLQSSGGVDQTSGSVSTDSLLLNGMGDFHLCLANSAEALSTTTVSADIDGDLFFSSEDSIALSSQQFTTLSADIVNHNVVDVSGNLTVRSSAIGGTAISDSTNVIVGADLAAIADGAADIELDQLDVSGAIGVVTVDGDATLINGNSAGFVFRADEIPGTPATEVCPHFELTSVNGDLFVQAPAGDITNQADASVLVSGNTLLAAGTTNANLTGGFANEFNILLGDQSNDDIQFSQLELRSRDASIQLDDSVELNNTFIGVPSASTVSGGTLFLDSTGAVTQVSGTTVVASNTAVSADDFIQLSDLQTDNAAFEATGFGNVGTLNDIPDSLPDDPGDPLAPRHTTVDDEYGIVVTVSNDVTLTTVVDPLASQNALTGIRSSGGHAFLETTGQGSIVFDGTGNTDIFTANGMTFDVAVETDNGHVLTTVAAGELTIAPGTVLVSSTGTVTNITPFNTDEGLEFENIELEGPLFQLFLPTTNDTPTTMTVNNDDTQFIGLNLGRAGEQNFFVEALYADGTFDVLNFNAQTGMQFQQISHTFSPSFLFANFELPAELALFNDSGINLFDNAAGSGAGLIDLNTNTNFVLAFSDSRPQGDLNIASVDRPEPVLREEIFTTVEQTTTTVSETTGFADVQSPVTDDFAEAFIIRLDSDGTGIEETRQDLNETSVTRDVIDDWKDRVEDSPQYPPGAYRIEWTESGVSFSIEFEKGAEEDASLDDLTPLDRTGSGDDVPGENENREPDEVVPDEARENTSIPAVHDSSDVAALAHPQQPGISAGLTTAAIAVTGAVLGPGKPDSSQLAITQIQQIAKSNQSLSFSRAARLLRKGARDDN